MLKLFKYEGYKIVISEEAFALKPFRQIWQRDKTVNKDKAIMELGFIYFMNDPRSDYQYLTNEDERKEAIKEGEGLPPKWEPDRKLLRDIDLTQVDDKGKPVYTLNTITATIKQIPSLVKDLDEAEKALASEIRNAGKMRGSGEKTIFEDDLTL